MTEEAKEQRRAYRREWRKKNKDKINAATERYWERRAAEARDKQEKQEV